VMISVESLLRPSCSTSASLLWRLAGTWGLHYWVRTAKSFVFRLWSSSIPRSAASKGQLYHLRTQAVKHRYKGKISTSHNSLQPSKTSAEKWTIYALLDHLERLHTHSDCLHICR
jgi:hypothetical protein